MPTEGYAIAYGSSKKAMPHLTSHKPIKSLKVAVEKGNAYKARYPGKPVSILRVTVVKRIKAKK